MKRRTRNYARRQLTWMRKLAGVEVIDVDRARPDCRRGRDPRLRRPMTMRFEKWQALGNDYLILEAGELPFELTRGRVRRLCEGHFGIFADGVLLLSPPADGRGRRRPADLQPRRLRGRAVGQRRPRGDPLPAPPRLDRPRRVLDPHRRRTHPATRSPAPTPAAVDMGRARLTSRDYPGRARRTAAATIDSAGREWRFRHVSIGNPQCAIHVADIAELEAARPAGDRARRSKPTSLFPNRTNVSWYTELEPERPGRSARGSSSAGWGRRSPPGPAPRERRWRTSTTYAAGERPGEVAVMLDGGELQVEVGEDLRVNLTGWARPVFAGEISEEFEKELHETE